jgi:hypothetical protein
MTRFAASAALADETHVPVVEGISVQLETGLLPDECTELMGQVEKQAGSLLGGVWTGRLSENGEWIDLLPSSETPPAPLARAWETTRSLEAIPRVVWAEPLTLIRVAAAEEEGASGDRSLWGLPYDDATRNRIDQESLKLDWSLENMNVPAAWATWRSKPGATGEPGAGVIVAHPDTGYTRHEQLVTALVPHGGPTDTTFGWDFVDRDPRTGKPRPDGLDPLVSEGVLTNPGHGTSTGSVIVSRKKDAAQRNTDKEIAGVAPGASLLPLRVSTSVVHFSFANLVEAFEKAVEPGSNVDVISMSLGGPVTSKRLEAAVRKALDRGVIVVSAAGNMLPLVVFPAKLPGVIAVAASNPLDFPWRHSGLGDEVAVTAPGEMVWHAVPDSRRQINRWNGTSFSAANVAGSPPSGSRTMASRI